MTQHMTLYTLITFMPLLMLFAIVIDVMYATRIRCCPGMFRISTTVNY